jgi:hypothetical protein
MQLRTYCFDETKIPLVFGRWISTNKLAIMLVNAYYINQNWALYEVPLALDEVDHLFFSHFES